MAELEVEAAGAVACIDPAAAANPPDDRTMSPPTALAWVATRSPLPEITASAVEAAPAT